MKNRIVAAFFVLSGAYLGSLIFSPYAFQYIPKALPIALLIVMVVNRLAGIPRVIVASALLFSLAGDVVLTLSIKHSFLAGLTCFFLAHIAYVMAFCSLKKHAHHTQHSKAPSILAKGLISFCVIVFALLMAMHILPASKTLYVPVLAYLSIILVMGLSAVWLGNTRFIIGGALLFVISDAVLAQSVFRSPLPLSPFLVMLTYYAAQFCLAFGLVTAFKREGNALIA